MLKLKDRRRWWQLRRHLHWWRFLRVCKRMNPHFWAAMKALDRNRV